MAVQGGRALSDDVVHLQRLIHDRIQLREGGGAALPVPAVTDVLRRGGAEVRILAFTRRDGRAIPPMEAAGLDVIVREGGEKDHVAALRWLDRQIIATRPTHLWTSLSRATLLGQLAGARRRIPVVSWQHAAYLKPANRRLLRAMQGMSRLWVGDSDAVTRLTAERLRVPPERLVQFRETRSGVDRDHPSVKKKLGANTWAICIAARLR